MAGSSVHRWASSETMAGYRRPMPAALADLPRPAAIFFDLDGTLVDTVETRIRAWLAVFAEKGIPASREHVAALIGADGRRLAREVADAAGTPLAEGEDELIDARAGKLYEGLNRDPRPLPGARDLLEALEQRRIRWAIATSSRRAQVAASVAALRLAGAPTVVDGSGVEHAKPAPDLLLQAAASLGVEPAESWYVGDSTWDMRSAVAAGMLPIGVTAGAAVDAEALNTAGARVTLGDLRELLAGLPG
jgi:HAD superfamily hydrolase (TIGR01509 family)